MASVDAPADNRAFAEKNGATFAILSDPGKQMVTNYGALSDAGYAKRWTYYINKRGIIVKIDRDVDPRTAGVSLVQNLKSLGVPGR